MTDLRPFGGDIAVYEGMLNLDTFVLHPFRPQFLGIQATISYAWSNKYFGYQWSQALDHSLPPLPYHVTYPKESGPFAAPVAKQLENIFRTAPDPGAGRVVDLELDHNGSLDVDNPPAPPAQIAEVNWRIIEAVHAHDGEWPVLYSRKNLIDLWLVTWSQAMLDRLWYWLAQYLADRTREDPGPLRLPARVKPSLVIMHQTADKVPSAQFGVGADGAKEFDTDRWVGVMPIAGWFNRRSAAPSVPAPLKVRVEHPASIIIEDVQV